MLSTKNLLIKTLSRKLEGKYIGPLRVRKIIGLQAYRLWLLLSYSIHNVFYVSLLKLYYYRLGTSDEDPPMLEIDNEEVWEVDAILSKRKHKGQLQYLIR